VVVHGTSRGGAAAGRRQPQPQLHGRGGRPPAWPLERILVTKLVLVVVAAALMLLMVGSSPSPRGMAFAAGATAFAWVVPELLLYNTGEKRRQVIQLALPDTLDQLTIAVEAGLGFEAALQQTARNSKGPLPEELIRTLQDIQVGQPRRIAYLALGERTQVQDLQRFVRAIVQADEHGVSIARVLSTQAREMRIKRRQRAEEKAMQIPVKVIFPLILFICRCCSSSCWDRPRSTPSRPSPVRDLPWSPCSGGVSGRQARPAGSASTGRSPTATAVPARARTASSTWAPAWGTARRR
jgi:tight adherence protein C